MFLSETLDELQGGTGLAPHGGLLLSPENILGPLGFEPRTERL